MCNLFLRPIGHRRGRSATGTVENIEEGNDLEEREIARFGRKKQKGK
jgi:hypothetical protein